MPKLIDLTGKKFGKLTVIGRDYETQKLRNDREPWWYCICECGNKNYSARGHDLRDGKIISCGCKRRENARLINFKDLTGQKFGKLTVIEIVSERRDNHCCWLCQCDCGSPPIIVMGKHLLSGDTTSCGCIKSKGEEKIINILNNLQINYKTQQTFDDCVYKQSLKFDFYLPNKDILIEYNGIQHYKPITAFGGEEIFKEQQQRDKIKIDWCKEHNKTLLIVPYTDFLILSEEYLESLINNKENS